MYLYVPFLGSSLQRVVMQVKAQPENRATGKCGIFACNSQD